MNCNMNKVEFIIDLVKLLMKYNFPINIVKQGGRTNRDINIVITANDYKRNHYTDG